MIHSSACSGSQRSRSLVLHHVTSSKDYFPCSILLRHLLNSLLCGHAHIPFAATPSPPTATASRHWLLISSDDPMTSPVGWHVTSLIGSASVISHNWGSLFTTSVCGCTFIWTSAYIQTHFFAVIFWGPTRVQTLWFSHQKSNIAWTSPAKYSWTSWWATSCFHPTFPSLVTAGSLPSWMYIWLLLFFYQNASCENDCHMTKWFSWGVGQEKTQASSLQETMRKSWEA